MVMHVHSYRLTIPPSSDGAAASAGLSLPRSITLTPAGDAYIADFGNCAVRKLSAQTSLVSTVAGGRYVCDVCDVYDFGMRMYMSVTYVMCMISVCVCIYAVHTRRIHTSRAHVCMWMYVHYCRTYYTADLIHTSTVYMLLQDLNKAVHMAVVFPVIHVCRFCALYLYTVRVWICE